MAAVLSREDMERIIREGGSVLYGGRTIVRIEDLPSVVDLVGDDAEQRKAAADALDAQIAALSAQRARLNTTASPNIVLAGPASNAPAVTGKVIPPAGKQQPSGETTPPATPSGEQSPPTPSKPSSGKQSPPTPPSGEQQASGDGGAAASSESSVKTQ